MALSAAVAQPCLAHRAPLPLLGGCVVPRPFELCAPLAPLPTSCRVPSSGGIVPVRWLCST